MQIVEKIVLYPTRIISTDSENLVEIVLHTIPLFFPNQFLQFQNLKIVAMSHTFVAFPCIFFYAILSSVTYLYLAVSVNVIL